VVHGARRFAEFVDRKTTRKANL